MNCRSGLLFVALGLIALGVACIGGPSGASDATPTQELSPTESPELSLTATTPTPLPTPRRVSLGHLSGNGLVPELPFPFAEPIEDPALEAVIVQALAEALRAAESSPSPAASPSPGAPPSYSVVVLHLGDGRSAAVNEDRVYYAASLFKLALLLEVYRQRDAGEIDFAQELVLEERYVAYDFGTLGLLGLQQDDIITVADAVRAMIIVSDTPTAIMVEDLVGSARVESTLQSLGLQDTHYVSALPASARDMATLIAAIAGGNGVSEGSRLEMLALLLDERIREGIPNGVPEDTAVAHKTGNWNDATHDVAIVWGPSGPYVIAVLSNQPWRWEPIVAISRAVYDYFVENP